MLPHKDSDDANSAHVEEGVKIKPITVGMSAHANDVLFQQTDRDPNTPSELELDEEGTRISLTIVDTPGFGDQVDNEARWVPFFFLFLLRLSSLGLSILRNKPS